MSKICRFLLLTVCSLSPLFCSAQLTQRIRGLVRDKDSRYPLSGASITDMHSHRDAVTDTNGHFELADLPLGKYALHISRPGYQPVILQDVLLTSAKEVVLTIDLEESAARIEEVVVRGKKEKINEMALVSVKAFDVAETERYAGSRADPARMASNFAGVQGADDSRNDIIIRGNSPQGLLWRLEDINIPNPNHFAVAGTTGGPVSMLNNKTIGNSEFFTGAFPAAYGNAVAGAFDLKLRNGNTERHEFTAQLGLLGTELAAEGPLSRKQGSSFLVAYRYSTLQLFQGLNIRVGTASIPRYQDLSFKLQFPVGKKGNLSLFGIGGLSSIDLIVSKLEDATGEIYGESDRDQYFHANTGIVGAAYSHTFNSSSYTRLSVGFTRQESGATHEKVFRDADMQVDSLKNILGYSFGVNTLTAHWFYNRKFGARHSFQAGLINDLFMAAFTDSSRQFPPTRQDWQHRVDYRGNTDLAQAYVQYRFRPGNRLTFTAGLHGQYLSHNGATALEPRAGMQWRPNIADVFSLGYGLHSQMQQLYQYFAHLPQNAPTQLHNYNMGFTRSHHLVAGHGHSFGGGFNLRTEVYYQYLFNIPIEQRAGSSFSAVNQGASFDRLFPDTLRNAGTGYNYGLELTLSRAFRRGYYFLFTGSVFDSKARGNDGVYRNTDYNSLFAMNLLGGYEKKLGRNSTLISGGKITWAGGRRYSPPDVPASDAYGELVPVDSLRNTLQFPDYFRADLKLGVRINTRRLTHELAVDLVNVLGMKNVLALTYSPDLAARGEYPFYKTYQLGFLPLFYYRVDFSTGKK
jgi:hypothetical protein